MARSILKTICCCAAAAVLSGCFFGHQTPRREIVQAQRAEQKPAPKRATERRAAKAIVVATAVPKLVPPNLDNVIYFGSDAYLPDPEFESLLQAHAEELKAEPRRRVLLKGHGDATGGPRYSLALATKRAETVAKALRSHGVSAGQLDILAVPGGDADAATTRRVELIYR